MKQGSLPYVYKKYEKASARAAYVATNVLHPMQLKFLKVLEQNMLDGDPNENMSVSALLAAHDPLPPMNTLGSDDDSSLGSDWS